MYVDSNGNILEIDDFGNRKWYKKGYLNRENGPAVEFTDGAKHWFINGKYHRLDGPAVEYCNGDKAWFYHGKKIDCESQKDFERLIKLKAFW